jgi:hypothetical protein
MAPFLSLLSLLVLFGATSSALAKRCEVQHGDDSSDDSPAILKAFQSCNTDSEIVFTSGVNYNAWTPMSWNNLCALHSLQEKPY